MATPNSNVLGWRTAFRVKTGYPGDDATSKTRFLQALNTALRHLWGDLPEALLREEMRFRLEKHLDGVGTVSAHNTDNHVLVIADKASGQLKTDGTVNARWIEVKKAGNWVQRRIQTVFVASYLGTNRDHIVIDQPWENLTDTSLPFRVYTQEYPYPADVQRIRRVIVSPEDNPSEILPARFAEDLARTKLWDGWRTEGEITEYARGQFFQLPAPHFAPAVTVDTPGVAVHDTNWGFDGTGVEHGSAFSGLRYGVAGTFSYLVCVGWGRRRWVHVTHDDGTYLPFYISAPSVASAKVATTWDGGRLIVTLPNLSYVYGLHANPLLPSYNKSGLEYWIFRARHAAQASGGGNNAFEKLVESDEVYYLWRVVDASTTVVYDDGGNDPPDRRFPLKDFHGHFHLRFDRSPSTEWDVMLDCIRRPATLEHESDVPNVPPEAMEALLALTASYLVGERDGSMDRKNAYYAEYIREVGRLRELYALPAFERMAFTDGLGIGTGPRPHRTLPIKEG